MTMTLDGTNGVTFNDTSLQGAAASPYVLKNRIINGAMVIDQRNAGANVNPAVAATYYLDRWIAQSTAAGKFSIGQNAGAVTPPAGFTYYLGTTSLSAYTVATGEAFGVRQLIEGYNIADLAWGTANAKTVTLSFQVYSSLTGTFGGALRNSSNARSYPFSYTISTANTWTQISVTIAGDTSGTWLTTNGVGVKVDFSIGAGATFSGTAGSWAGANYTSATGATSVVGTNGATFYITGVQLEIGSTATPFERRLYGQELANCQRYYWKMTAYNSGGGAYAGLASGVASTTTGTYVYLKYPVAMRAEATFIGSGLIMRSGTTNNNVNSPNVIYPGTDSSMLEYTGLTSTTAGYAAILFVNGSTTNYLSASAEL